MPVPLNRRAPEILAVVVELAGDVSVRLPNARATPVRHFDLVPADVQLVLGEASRVVLFCAENEVRLETETEPRRELLDRARCQRGEPLAPALRSSPRLVDGLRLRVLQDHPVLEDSYRNGEFPTLLLRPRCPLSTGRVNEKRTCGSLLDARPTLVWRDVPGAIEYRLRADVGTVYLEQRIRRNEVSCSLHRQLGESVCSRRWPGTWPSLPMNARVILSVDHRSALHQAWPFESLDTTIVERLDEDNASALKKAEAQLLARLSPGAPREILIAGLFASFRQLGEAAERLEVALDRHPSAVQGLDPGVLHLALGDVYFHQMLFDSARGQYLQVLKRTTDLGLKDAATLSVDLLRAASSSEGLP